MLVPIALAGADALSIKARDDMSLLKRYALTMVALAIPTFAQTSVKVALAKHWKVSGEFTIAVANAMPGDSYNFKPNPDEMTFGQLMAHIAGVNLNAQTPAA